MNELSHKIDHFHDMAEVAVLGEPSLADAMAAIAADATIPVSKRRHWLTSMRGIAGAIGRPPESLPCRMTALRHHLNRLNAAALNWEQKTLSSHKSNLKAAINHFMRVEGVPRRGAPLLSVWKTLLDATVEVKPRRLLSGLARYCSARNLQPTSVSEELVGQYFVFREATSFLRSGVALTRELMKAWNWCVEQVPGWPQRLLAPPGLAKTTSGPDWSEFPQGLRCDIEAYLANLAKPHRSPNGRRRRACRPSTLSTRRRELIAFARTAMTAGTPIETLTSLEALLAPGVITPALEAYLDRNGVQPRGYTIDLTWKLLSIAKAIGAPPDTIIHLDDIRARLEENRGPVLTEKNIKVIRAILMTNLWSRVLALPQSLMAEAQRMLNWTPQKAATLAAVALQVQILTRAPVRVGNLLSIRIGHNLTRAGSNESNYRLHFPNYDVKNRVDLDFPLGKKTTEIIDQFIDVFRPHLGDGHRGDWLFPGENGKHRSSTHASVSIAKRVERETGLRVTAHQFRHGAAAMVLKAQPGNYEFARRVLGHRNIATTIRFYTALESFKAAEVFGAMMEEQMGNPGSGNLNAKQRVRRKGLTQPTSTMSGRGSKHGNK